MVDSRLRWAVSVSAWSPSDQELQFLLSLLSSEEQAACTRFRLQDDKKRAVVSRLLQRKCAVEVLDIPFSEVDIRRTKGGKPYVSNPGNRLRAPNFNYSVSHEVGLWWQEERRSLRHVAGVG